MELMVLRAGDAAAVRVPRGRPRRHRRRDVNRGACADRRVSGAGRGDGSHREASVAAGAVDRRRGCAPRGGAREAHDDRVTALGVGSASAPVTSSSTAAMVWTAIQLQALVNPPSKTAGARDRLLASLRPHVTQRQLALTRRSPTPPPQSGWPSSTSRQRATRRRSASTRRLPMRQPRSGYPRRSNIRVSRT